MSQNQILLIFCVACFAGYFIAYIKKRPSALLFVIGRSTAGLGFIYFFNFFCAARDIVTGVGINPITGTVCTLFGIPGAILLYAVRLYSFLYTYCSKPLHAAKIDDNTVFILAKIPWASISISLSLS